MVITTFYIVFSIIIKQDLDWSIGAGLAMFDIINMFTFLFVHNVILSTKSDNKTKVLRAISATRDKK